eukprot:51727-Amphidinium_carterae.1
MLKDGSPTTDSSELALLASLLLIQVGARAWYEHVPPACNPVGPLSRAALEDPWVQEKLHSGAWT